MKNIINLLFLLVAFNIQGQVAQDNSDWMQYITEMYDEEEENNEYIDNLFDELSDITENPYNLQTVTKTELKKLPFLSDQQIENLLYYIYKYGPLVDIYELKNVEDMDLQTVFYLLPFVYIEKTNPDNSPPPDRNIFKYIKQEFMLRSNLTIQKKEGYKKVSPEEQEESPNKYYLGDPFHMSFRYNLNIGNKIQAGITGEKDAGEKFKKSYPPGFDYYTYNILVRNIGIIEELHLGNYRLSFGQGLVMNNNFSMRKTTDIAHLTPYNNGIKRHLSTNENNYFSGIAGKVKYRNLYLTSFYSNKNQDGSTDNKTIFSFKTDGLHRTYNDLLKRNTVNIQTFGKHFTWSNDFLALGFTSVYYSFGNKELNPELKPYNLHYLRGKYHYNLGFNYHYRSRQLSIKGETALDKSGKTAHLINLSLKPVSFLNWTISFRHYDKQYNAFFGNGFGETSSLQNETGAFTGIQLNLLRNWELSGYFDYFVFLWLKYNIDSPSSGNDTSLLLKYTHSKLQASVNYKRKEKDKNSNYENKKTIDVFPYVQHKIKSQINYIYNKNLSFKSQIHFNYFTEKGNRAKAWSVGQSCSFVNNPSTLQLESSITYFHTEDWNTRIYTYEKNILYSFNFTNYYGTGLRYYLLLKWQIIKPLTFYIKCSSTYYPDQESIGSGTEEIRGRVKSDISGLIKYNF